MSAARAVREQPLDSQRLTDAVAAALTALDLTGRAEAKGNA